MILNDPFKRGRCRVRREEERNERGDGRVTEGGREEGEKKTKPRKKGRRLNGGRQEGNNRYKKMRKERRGLKIRKRGKFEQE